MRRVLCLLAAVVLTVLCCTSAAAWDASTLCNGSKGEEVKALQQALIDLGYLKGKADGIFGNQTENAVRAFQSANGLTVDGLAGKKTRAMLQEAAAGKNSSSTATVQPAATPAPAATAAPAQNTAQNTSSASSSDGSLFGGNYATIRLKDRGDRVKVMQQALIRLNYLTGNADGIFGNKTLNAVLLFQQENNLAADGLAGKKTLKALETADKNGAIHGSSSTVSVSAVTEEKTQSTASAQTSATTASSSKYTSSSRTATAPDGGTIYLLHWFNDIKPSLKNGSNLLIYDPSTGISWTLKVHSRGRHCDAEPLTLQDTEKMVEAFGYQNTWTQKGVYVKLPSGVWTIGSTHDMPHMSGNVKDNGFDGHLCVHFLRDMSETQQNDPNYGVSNQKTIRSLWKSLTGEELNY